MRIWWIGIALYRLERDQSTQGILGWPARSRSTLGLQVDSDPVDHPGSVWSPYSARCGSTMGLVRPGQGDMQSTGLVDQIHPGHLDPPKIISQCSKNALLAAASAINFSSSLSNWFFSSFISFNVRNMSRKSSNGANGKLDLIKHLLKWIG